MLVERVARLSLSLSPGSETLEVALRAGSIDQRGSRRAEDLYESLESFSTLVGASLFDTGPGMLARVKSAGELLMRTVLPSDIAVALKRWSTARLSNSVLVVESDSPALSDLPWELLPSALRGDFLVAHLASGRQDGETGQAGEYADSVLAVGWDVLVNGESLAGVLEEVWRIPDLFDDTVSIVSLMSPSADELAQELESIRPQVVHLAVDNGFRVLEGQDGSGSAVVLGTTGQLSADEQLEFEEVTDLELVEMLDRMAEPRLVVFNSMPNPPKVSQGLYRVLAEAVDAVVVGWGGAIQDSIAAAFSPFLYRRLLEGESVLSAVKGFTRQYSDAQWVHGAMPTVWFPHLEWLDRRIFAPRAPGSPEGEQLKADFVPRATLFPSLVVNQHPTLESLNINSPAPGRARIQLVCDAGGRTSVFEFTKDLVAGGNEIDPVSIEFPVLYELLRFDEPRTITFQLKVWVDDQLEISETRSSRWKARRDWLDTEDSWGYLPAFVLPMSESIAGLVGNAERILAHIESPTTSFSGYSGDREEQAKQSHNQMRAIYQAVREHRLRYVVPPGAPVYVPNPATPSSPSQPEPPQPNAFDVTKASFASRALASGQTVRLPDDVLERGHGTCHDLALIVAAAAEYVGLRPLIVLIPGHTFVGYWRAEDDADAYWASRPSSTTFGKDWTIDGDAFVGLVAEQIEVVEATYVTNQNLTFDDAIRQARTYVDMARNQRLKIDVAVDISASRARIQSLIGF